MYRIALLWSFSGPNAESEEENIDFRSHDKPQAEPPPPEPHTPAPNGY